MRRQDPILISRSRPAHQLQRPEVGREKAEPGDPGGHFPAREEEILAGFGIALEVKADSQDSREVQSNDGQVHAGEGHEARRLEEECWLERR